MRTGKYTCLDDQTRKNMQFIVQEKFWKEFDNLINSNFHMEHVLLEYFAEL